MNNFNSIKAYSKLRKILTHSTPVLNTHIIKNIIKRYFDSKEKYLDILKTAPSPLYLLEKENLINSAENFKRAFKKHQPEYEFFYAVKSNNLPAISEILLQCHYGLEVSSGIELETAIRLNAKKIIFNGPGKTDVELMYAVQNSEKVTIIMDSIGEFNRLKKICNNLKKNISAGIRLTTTNTGLWKKFGIEPEMLPELWSSAYKSGCIKLCGIHFHSSWNLTPKEQVSLIEKISNIIKKLPKDHIDSIEFIDVGGGYWPHHGEWLHYSSTPEGTLKEALGINKTNYLTHYINQSDGINYFAETISKAITEYIHPIVRCKIYLEPGRWICNDAIQILLTVIDKKSQNVVITDGGTNAVGWERFESDYFPVLNLSKPELKEHLCNIYGSLCTPHDVWGFSYWGKGIDEGDILMIPMQGAYTYSLRQNFIKPIPNVVII